MLNSSRTFPGRLFSCMTSARNEPWVNLAVVRAVLMDLSFSTPPCARIFLAITSSTVCARATDTHVNEAASIATKTLTILESSFDCSQRQLTPLPASLNELRAVIVHQLTATHSCHSRNRAMD